MTIADAIRQAIKKSGKSANEISKITGVPQPTITRFLRGRDMRLSTADKLAGYLGVKVRVEQAGTAKKKPRAKNPAPSLTVDPAYVATGKLTVDPRRVLKRK